MRLIDADAFAKKAYDVAYPVVHGWNDHERGLTLLDIAQLLDEMPVVDAVPVRHGKWLVDNYDYYEKRFVCSVCGKSYKVDTCMGEPMWDFCPCGAKMDEEED